MNTYGIPLRSTKEALQKYILDKLLPSLSMTIAFPFIFSLLQLSFLLINGVPVFVAAIV